MFSYHFDILYALRVVVRASVLWLYRKKLPLRWNRSWSAIALEFLAFAIWIILLDRQNNPAATNASTRIGLTSLSAIEAGAWILFRIIGAVLIAPIAEELAFRGYIIRKLVSADLEAGARVLYLALISGLIDSFRSAARRMVGRNDCRHDLCPRGLPPGINFGRDNFAFCCHWDAGSIRCWQRAAGFPGINYKNCRPAGR